MKTVSIHDAKSNLSKYIEAVKKGEKVYIGGFGKAEVVLTKLSATERISFAKHDYSIAKGKVHEKDDSFAHSTDKQVADLLYGN